MYIYVLLVFLILILGITLENKHKKIYSVMICILFTIVAGCRHYSIGTDTANYARFFMQCTKYGSLVFNNTINEYGYVVLNLFISKITSNFNIFLSIVSLIINVLVCKFIRENSKDMCLSFLVFFLGRFFFSEMNIIREFIAISIFLFSVKFINEKKIFNYFLCIIIASFFHKSAFILMPFYFLLNMKLDNKKKIIISFLSVLGISFLYEILVIITNRFGIYSGYIEAFYDSNKIGSIVGFILYLFIYLFTTKIYNKNVKDNNHIVYDSDYQKNMIYNNLLFYSCIFSLVSIKMSVLNRITEYFSIFIIVCIPNSVQLLKIRNNRLIIKLLIVLFFAIYCFIITYYRPNWNSVYPYKFFFEV